MDATQRTALYNWATAVTGLTVAWGRQGGPRPAYPFAQLDVRTDRQQGRGELRYSEPDSDGNVIVSACATWLATIQLSVYAKAPGYDQDSPPLQPARDYLRKARTSLRMPSVLTALATAGLGLADAGGVVDFDIDDGDRWLSAAAFDLSVGYAVNDSDPTPITYIEAVALGATLTRPDDTTNTSPSGTYPDPTNPVT